LVESNNVKRTIKVIDDLLKAGIGDTERLKSIKEKLENNIRVTAEDVEYIQEQREELGKTPTKDEPEELTKKTPPEKQPRLENSVTRLTSRKKPIIVGVLGGIAILFLIFSADAYFTMEPISKLQSSLDRLENVRTEAELDQAFIEIYNDPTVIDACRTVQDVTTENQRILREEMAKIPPLPNGDADYISINKMAKKYKMVQWMEAWQFCQPVYHAERQQEIKLEKQEELDNLASEIKIPLEECKALVVRADKYYKDWKAKLAEGKGVPDSFCTNHPDCYAHDMFVKENRCADYYPNDFPDPIFNMNP